MSSEENGKTEEQAMTENLGLQRWSIENVEITCDTHWWGFELHLNEDATKLLELIDKFAGKLIGALGEEVKPIADLIKLYLKIRNVVIKAEDRGQGVKLVSPWIMPTLLVPLPEGEKHLNDAQLRWSVFDPSTNAWTAEQKMKTVYSEYGPALAVFRDNLYCVTRGTGTGSGDDPQLWCSVFDGSWSSDQIIGAHAYTGSSPALAVFEDKLICLARGTDASVWWMAFDGNAWGSYQLIENVKTAGDPALAVFQGKLHCVLRGTDETVWWMTFDGNNWGSYQVLPGVYSQSGTALAVFQDKLYMVCRGSGSDPSIWWMVFDGNGWGPYAPIPQPHVYTANGVGLAVFQDKLYCMAPGTNESMWWMAFDGQTWSQYSEVDGAWAYDRPGLVHYRHPTATRDQLLCVHRGIKT